MKTAEKILTKIVFMIRTIERESKEGVSSNIDYDTRNARLETLKQLKEWIMKD